MAEERITVEDLTKALEKLAKEGKTEVPAATQVTTAPLKKTAEEVLKEQATQPLRKALDASSALQEFATIMGLHVDESLQSMQKSIDQAAERDLYVTQTLAKCVEVLADVVARVDEAIENPALAEEVKDLAKKIEEFGDKPVQKPKSQQAQVLQKTVEEPAEKPALDRKGIVSALETLAKSTTNPSEATELLGAIATFESTGKINDQMLFKAMQASKPTQK